MRHRFEGQLIEGHGTLAVLVPWEVVEGLGEKERVGPRRFGYPVKAKVGRRSFDALILTRGLNAGLLLDDAQARELGLALGDVVKVEVERAPVRPAPRPRTPRSRRG